ncbi:Yae1 family protein [Streptomyces sp. NPDC003023]|uniref:Yae1 family protein n=1 Tax=Streptomyces sp. NPDC003023 TaxID=3364675 RepID=UPI0036B8E40A
MSRGTFFPGRGTIVEESYLKGVEEGREEGREKGREEGREKGCEEGLEAGRVEARAQMILRVLEKRRIPTLQSARDRITGCTDIDVLDQWVDRALTVTEAEDLFIAD